MKEAFITGSRAYGTPREDSDVDLCVLVTQEELTLLAAHFGKPGRNPENVTANLRCGNLNLIAMSSAEIFEIWRGVTQELIAQKPVTREFAVARFQEKIRNLYE